MGTSLPPLPFPDSWTELLAEIILSEATTIINQPQNRARANQLLEGDSDNNDLMLSVWNSTERSTPDETSSFQSFCFNWQDLVKLNMQLPHAVLTIKGGLTPRKQNIDIYLKPGGWGEGHRHTTEFKTTVALKKNPYLTEDYCFSKLS